MEAAQTFIANPRLTQSSAMAPLILAISFPLFAVICSLIWLRLRHGHRKLPPGPRGLPIIGSLHMLGELPHRSLQNLAKKYGPIMSIRLGNVPTIIVSSPEAAQLFLKTHDIVFADRSLTKASQWVSYGNKGLAFTPYSSYWRHVRKFCTLELLSTTKIDSMAGMRMEELGLLVQSLKEAAKASEVVNFTQKVTELIENNTYRMLFGHGKYDKAGLRSIIQDSFVLLGAFNIADFVPFLEPFDLQGLTRKLKAASKGLDEILETIIREHEVDDQNRGTDIVDLMLSLQKSTNNANGESSYKIDRNGIKAIIFDIIAGSIDTSYSSIEWIFAELMRNPRVLEKLQEELNDLVGVDRMVEETDLPKLEYLDMVIKETYRLHPIAPLLVPRESREDIVINGYYIPKKSRVMISAWTIGRDRKVWSDNVNEFLPERFIDRNIDLRGHDFELLPFGSGRRGCPGMHLGLTNIRSVVAQLVHCFDWKLPDGMSIGDLDMSEKFGLAMPRAKHLHVVPTCRLPGLC